ncbi:MAG: S8 family serine peptidase [Saprospiraceae bacterium]|nr:S8 family serine peptidase [Saprospiraceae bacterium]
MGTKLHYAVVVLAFVCCWGTTFGQSQAERLTITKDYNKQRLSALQQQLSTDFQSRKTNAWNLAAQRGWETIIEEPNGGISELVDVTPDGRPVYFSTENASAAQTTRTNTLYNGGGLGLNVEGQNMFMGIWDGGAVRTSHEIFGGRVAQKDNAGSINSHATHVSGTLIGGGNVEGGLAQGMAHQASLDSYDWNNDEAEVAAAAANGLLVSSHSYGINAGTSAVSYLGYYDANARNFDEIMYNAPYYQMVCSAGNDRNDNINTGDNGYDKLTDMSLSKNAIVVGGVNEVLNYTGPSSVNIYSASSWGPTDDGRIKPDIMGKGVNTYSSTSASNNSYGTSSGTSMATPNVSGTLLLLQQHYNNVNGNFMRASTLRGLALHTADEAGDHPGPDYRFGWGLLNAQKAAETITNNGTTSMISEELITEGSSFTTTVNATGNETLMISITWTDLNADLLPQIEDLATPSLVNDLDIRVTKNGETFFPWRLDPGNPAAAATTGDNLVDNIEKIEIPGATGEYTITVTHKGSLAGSLQNFSLVVTGGSTAIVPCDAVTPSNLQAAGVEDVSATLTWDAVPGAGYDVRYKKTADATWIEPTVSNNFITLEGLDVMSEYEAQVRSKCDSGTSAWSASTLFTTKDLIITFCSSQGSSTADEYISRVQLANIDNSSAGGSGYTDFTAVSTELFAGQDYTITITPTWTGTIYNEAYSVWIDYNNDGDFDDNSEQVWSKAASKDTPVGGTFTVPAGIEFGSKRMRVSMKYNAIPSSCETFSYGEVEDYTVIIGEFVDTDAPSIPMNLTATDITQTSLLLSWDASTDVSGIAGYGIFMDGAFIGSAVTTSLLVENLSPETTYSFEVAARDLANNISANSAPYGVTTLSDNACPDNDGDGVCNADDICPGGDDNIDLDNDGIPDFCDTCEEITLDLTGTINSYGGSQDNGSAELVDGNTLKLSNNAWKYIDLNYTVTSNTVVSFEFRSDIQGEIHGIAFDNNNSISSNYTFKVHGTQSWGNRTFDTYSGSDWMTFTIPVGDYYTGVFDRFAFVMDHDGSPKNGDAYFRNVKIFEDANGDLVCNDANATNAEDEVRGGQEENDAEGTLTEVQSIKIYPNPTAYSVFVSGLELGAEFEIYNMSGARVLVDNYEGEIVVSDLPSGQYFIRVIGEKGIAGRFTKQ